MARILATNRENIYLSTYFTLGFPQRLFSFIFSKEFKVRSPALLMLANISFTDNKKITDDLIARGVIKHLE